MPEFKYSEYYKKKNLESEKKKLEANPDTVKKKETQPLPVISGPNAVLLTEVKKAIEKDYNRTWEFLILPKHIKVLKFLVIVLAVLLLIFLIYKNFISAEEFNYFYNIGSNANYL